MSASSWSVHKRSGAKVKPPASMLLACSLLPGWPLVSMQATGFPYSAPHSCIGVGVSPLPCWPPLPFMHSQPPLSDCALSAAGRQVVAGLARPLRPLANQTISQTCSGLSASASLEATASAWAKAEVFCKIINYTFAYLSRSSAWSSCPRSWLFCTPVSNENASVCQCACCLLVMYH